jgi:hypothetical protein
MRREYLPARIALAADGISMIVLYPLNMLVFERPSWVWDYPDPNRHAAYVGRHLRDDGRFSRLGGAQSGESAVADQFRDRLGRDTHHSHGVRCQSHARPFTASCVAWRCGGHLCGADYPRSDAPATLRSLAVETSVNSVAGAGRADHSPRLAVFGEARQLPDHKFAGSTGLSKRNRRSLPETKMKTPVNWQRNNHEGFICERQ